MDHTSEPMKLTRNRSGNQSRINTRNGDARDACQFCGAYFLKADSGLPSRLNEGGYIVVCPWYWYI